MILEARLAEQVDVGKETDPLRIAIKELREVSLHSSPSVVPLAFLGQ